MSGFDSHAALAPDALPADERVQFERHGYFVTDRCDHTPAQPVFNRVTGLKDSRSK